MNASDDSGSLAHIEETLSRMERRLANVERMLGVEHAPEREPAPAAKRCR